MNRWGIVAVLLLAGPMTLAAQDGGSATPAVATRIVVHVVAHDAKVIGSHVGGVHVAVLDATTGDTLASGLQSGGTGNTDLIMRRPRERGRTIFDTPGTASFQATLELSRPTRVRVVAEGPLGVPDATERASTSLVLLPGHDLTGDGVVIELYGLAVTPHVAAATAGGDDAASPGATRDGVLVVAGPSVSVGATVTMLCGCPITPGGLWDARRVRVRARLLRGETVVAEAPLSYAGRPSTFEGRITAPAPGVYRLVVVAADPDRANLGRASRRLRVGAGG